MRFLKYSLVLLFTIFFIFGCSSSPKGTVVGPKIYLKEICAMYDINWHWDSISQLVSLHKNNRSASILLGSDVAILGSKKVYLSQPLLRERSMIVVPNDFKEKIIDLLIESTQPEPKKTRSARASKAKKPFRIIIDPGHGGKDPGAVGISGLQEKIVVLDISLRLREILEVQGYDVELTRENDQFITLGERTEIASRNKADLFVSVHANSSPSRSARGVEVFTLRKLEPHEVNEEQRLKNYGLMFRDLKMEKGNKTLNQVVSDMMFNYKQAESRVVAQYLAHGVSAVAQANNRGLRLSGFFVLRNTLIPAVLVEVGFLTNSREEKLMLTAAYRQKVANGLAVSIMKYAGK